MAMSLEEQQKRQLAASLAVDLVKSKVNETIMVEHFIVSFDKIYDAIYGKLSEKA